MSYETTHGPIPKGMKVCHTCDTPPCVNPEHLFLGTQKDNILDAVRKGRMDRLNKIKGSKHYRAKLTEVQVKAILKDTRLHRKIAEDYNIDKSQISRIKRGKTWKHVRE